MVTVRTKQKFEADHREKLLVFTVKTLDNDSISQFLSNNCHLYQAIQDRRLFVNCQNEPNDHSIELPSLDQVSRLSSIKIAINGGSQSPDIEYAQYIGIIPKYRGFLGCI